MGKRRNARESALQILYQLEFDSTEVDRTIDLFWRKKRAPEETKEYSRWLVKSVRFRQDEVDDAIQSVAEHWRIGRMGLIDRNILRLAAIELLEAPQVAPAVVINEAIEIAKKFSGPESATFVNGILDALRKKIQAIESPTREVKDVRKERRKGKTESPQRSKKD
jgi:N utilization substance protein B